MRRIYSGAWVERDRDTHELPGRSSSLKYHVVWCPKYRRQVLVPPVDTRLKTIIETVAAAYGFTVHAMEVMPDHLHLFIAADPTPSSRR